MAASSSAVQTIDSAIWHAVAGSSVQIPPPNSFVYYFPQGHLEQYGHSAVTRNFNSTKLDLPFIPCQILSVGLFYDPLSEQPFARILLQPANKTWRQQQQQPKKDDEKDDVVSYTKVLTPSDANNGGGFSVPRSCADLVFPRLDFAADPPVQNLWMKDARGDAWEFRHIYRGTPRRHLLTTGWSKFVNAKRLVAGDSVVFMSKKKSTAYSGDHHLFIGIRRAGKFGGVNSFWKFGESSVNGGGVSSGEALVAIEKAARGVAFEVVYYPRIGSPDFIVMTDKVEEASRICWSAGMRVKMEVETEDSTRTASSEGTIAAAALPESGLWRGSPWRMLQVTWDDPETVPNVDRVSPWEIAYIPPASEHLFSVLPPSKKFKHFPDHYHQERMLSNGEGEFRHFHSTAELTSPVSGQGDDQCDNNSNNNNNHNIPKQTFTQLLTNCISQSSHVGTSSFRLFGKTIRMSETTVEGGSGKN